ncbi:MAG TPA: acyl-CoA dehydrogenase family protein, partial [Acidimicrobiales bacterium]|nr:acyl-CoA dehydrogenase family protein [Acidimicrobiales bacterium]
MDFGLTDDQQGLKQLCRDFARREIAPNAGEWWEKEVFPTDVFRQMGELGLMGLLVPEDYGGTNAGMVAYVAAMEEIGGADQSVGAAWNAHITIGSLPILAFGTEAQKQRWLRPLAEGRNIGAFGLTEPQAGSDAAGIRTRAERDGDSWVVNGTKMFISNAGTDMSLGVTILAVTGRDGDG